MKPVRLRHPDATKQAGLWAGVAIFAAAPIVFGITSGFRLWPVLLLLTPVVLFAAYSAIRLATLQVRLDEHGIWEPNPFRLTYVTPWREIRKIDPYYSTGARKLNFVAVRLTYYDGDKREIVALKTQAGAAHAEATVLSWVEEIRAAKKEALSRP